MLRGLRQRAEIPELMDDPAASEAELRRAYRHLRVLNRVFGASAPTLYGVQWLWEKSGKPKQLNIFDVGAGSGDVNRLLLKWAVKKQVNMRIVLIDPSPAACSEAGRLFADESRVDIRQGNVYDLPQDGADIVTGTQFLHHFASQQIPQVIGSMVSCARIGVVLNDIHRHLIAWIAVWFVTRIISRNRMIIHDGPLSVAKGFRLADWRELSRELDTDVHVSWRPLFRYAAIIPSQRIGRRSDERGL